MLIEKLKKLAREPLLHFLLIGAGIYGLYGIYAEGDDGDNARTITISSSEIRSLGDQWTRSWSRPPTSDELSGIVRERVRTRVLFREAQAMGLDKDDLIIERRLAQKLEFMAQGLLTPQEPSDQILADWYAANSERFKQPDLYTLTQIFFDPDKRGEATLNDAKAALGELVKLDTLPENYDNYGDRIMLQNHYPARSEQELRSLFGSGFADQVVSLDPGVWHGPVLSGYGAHLVLINDVMRTPLPAYEDIKEQLVDAWTTEEIDKLSENFIASLISRYEIVVEEAEVPLTIPGNEAAFQ